MNMLFSFFKKKEITKPTDSQNNNNNSNPETNSNTHQTNISTNQNRTENNYNIYNSNTRTSYSMDKQQFKPSETNTDFNKTKGKSTVYQPPNLFSNMKTSRGVNEINYSDISSENSNNLTCLPLTTRENSDSNSKFNFIKKSNVSKTPTNTTEIVPTDKSEKKAFGFINKKKQRTDESCRVLTNMEEEDKRAIETNKETNDQSQINKNDEIKQHEADKEHINNNFTQESKQHVIEDNCDIYEKKDKLDYNQENSTDIQKFINSIEDEIRSYLNKSSSKYLELMKNINQTRASIANKEETLNSELNFLEELVLKENEAVESNNFEEAQKLEENIVCKNEEIKDIKNTLENYKLLMMTYRQDEIEIFKTQFNSLENLQKSLSQIKIDQSVYLEKLHENEMKQINNFSKEIDILKVKQSETSNFLNIEGEKIANEENELKAKISQEAEEIFKELETLNEAKSTLNVEIMNLRKELEEKENNLILLNNSINQEEKKLESIKQNFKNDIDNLSVRKSEYDKQNNILNDVDKLLEKKTGICSKKNKFLEEKTTEINDRLNKINENLIKLQCNLDEIENDIDTRECLLVKEKVITDKMYSLKEKSEKLEEQLKLINDQIQNFDFSNKRLDSEIVSTDVKLLNLEQEKKAHISNKNYKDAANVSNEIKSLTESKNKHLLEIETNKESINSLLSLRENQNKEKEELLQLIDKTNKDYTFLKYEYFLKYRSILSILNNEYENENCVKEELRRVEDNINKIDAEISNKNINQSNTIYSKSECKSELVGSEEISINKYENDVEVEMDKNKDDQNDKIEKDVVIEIATEDPTIDNDENIKNMIEMLQMKLDEYIKIEDYEKAEETNNQLEELKMKYNENKIK